MKLEKCREGHFYDHDKFDKCPHCENGIDEDAHDWDYMLIECPNCGFRVGWCYDRDLKKLAENHHKIVCGRCGFEMR